MQKHTDRASPQRRPGLAVADEDPMDIPMEDQGGERADKSEDQRVGADAGDAIPDVDQDADKAAQAQQSLLGPRA